MSTQADTILDTALLLPSDERAWLAAELIASLSGGGEKEIEAAWAAEIDKRIDEIETGEAASSGWEEARARIRAAVIKS
jgi:putative addiction module component (TIGR02574 family)